MTSRQDDQAGAARALSAWAARRGLVPEGAVLTLSPLSGGSSNLTDLVTGPDTRWVLRRPPVRGVLPTGNDMAREYRVQAALGSSAVPVPAMVALEEDPGVLGAPFYVMEHLDGVVHASADGVRALAPETAREAGLALARTLAALHEVDPETAGLGAYRRAEPYLRRQLRRWRGQWERSRLSEVPLVDELLDRLEAAAPDGGPQRVVHGDYNLANVMYERDRPGVVRAVLDWEMATVGDPLADLGQLLTYWGPAGRLLFAGRGGHLPDANPALPDAAALVAAYEEARGEAVRDLVAYEAFAAVKLAVICAGAARRVRRAGDEAALADQRARIVPAVRGLAEIARDRLGS